MASLTPSEVERRLRRYDVQLAALGYLAATVRLIRAVVRRG